MPIVITYDIEGGSSTDHNRVQSLFERFGWENLGGSSYRYPSLGSDQPTEDWFNHVIPALMLFRAFMLKLQSKGKKLRKFSIDSQSSTGHNPVTVSGTVFGTPPLAASGVRLYKPKNNQFGAKKLRQWLSSVTWPY